MPKKVFILCLCTLLLCACQKGAIPKPYGYVRIATPDTAYTPYQSKAPYTFALSQNAQVVPHTAPKERYWIDIVYPALNATIHGSYHPIRGDLDLLTNDAFRLVYKHAGQAVAIPEQPFVNPERSVYGMFFSLEGNVASPYQFFVTDSVHHFFRASVYCDCKPNADSLAPIYEYLEQDVRHLIETWQWQD